VGPENPDLEIHFHRGLVRVTLPPTHLTLKAIPQPLKSCFEQGWVEMVRIGNRSLRNFIEINRLCKWPLSKHITHLDLSRCYLDEDDLSKLFASKYLSGLTTLDLGNVQFPYQQLIDLASLDRLPNLQYVPGDCDTRLGYLRTLFRQHPHLKCQDQSMQTIGYGEENPETNFRFKPKVGLLSLAGFELSIQFIKFLASAPETQNLRALILSNCSLNDFGVQTLMKSPYLQQLQVLDVGRNKLGDKAAIAIANASEMKNLFYLQLEYNSIGNKGVCALADAPQLSNLRLLDFGPNRVGDKGLIVLAESPYLKHLELISLWNNRVTDRGIVAWANSPNALHLRELYIGNNSITDIGAKALADSPYLTNLWRIRLENISGDNHNHISKRAQRMLIDRFGDGIEVDSLSN
jgi:hypothetical protein